MKRMKTWAMGWLVCGWLSTGCAAALQTNEPEMRQVQVAACEQPVTLERHCSDAERARVDAAAYQTSCENLSTAVRALKDVSPSCRGCQEETGTIGARYTECNMAGKLPEDLASLAHYAHGGTPVVSTVKKLLTNTEAAGGDVYGGLLKFFQDGQRLTNHGFNGFYQDRPAVDQIIEGVFMWLKDHHASEEEALAIHDAVMSQENDDAERRMLLWYLRESGHAEASFKLAMKNLASEMPSTRSGACKTIGRLGVGPELVTFISKVGYQDTDRETRRTCVDAVRKIEVRTQAKGEGFTLPE